METRLWGRLIRGDVRAPGSPPSFPSSILRREGAGDEPGQLLGPTPEILGLGGGAWNLHVNESPQVTLGRCSGSQETPGRGRGLLPLLPLW